MKFVKEASAEVAEAAVQNDATSKLKSKKIKRHCSSGAIMSAKLERPCLRSQESKRRNRRNNHLQSHNGQKI